MSHTITVRLGKELASWLEETASKTGVPQGQLIREQLEQAKAARTGRSYMRLAGCIKGRPKNLSVLKGYSRG